MLENTGDIRNKAKIHFQASTGGRVGIHDHPLLIKHLTMMEGKDMDAMLSFCMLMKMNQ